MEGGQGCEGVRGSYTQNQPQPMSARWPSILWGPGWCPLACLAEESACGLEEAASICSDDLQEIGYPLGCPKDSVKLASSFGGVVWGNIVPSLSTECPCPAHPNHVACFALSKRPSTMTSELFISQRDGSALENAVSSNPGKRHETDPQLWEYGAS